MLIRKTPWRNESEPVIVIMAVLLLLGTINVFSSSFVLATTSYNNPYYFLIRHAVWLVLGIFVCFVCSRVNYHRWQGITKCCCSLPSAHSSWSCSRAWSSMAQGVGSPLRASACSRRSLPSSRAS